MEFEDKSKLFVFEKKEVILIFVFVIVITVTAFTLGVKVGKGIFLGSKGLSTPPSMNNSIDLKSVEEEGAENIATGNDFESSLNSNEKVQDSAKEDLSIEGIEKKLKDEFSKASKGEKAIADEIKPKVVEKMPNQVDSEEELFIDGDANAGKFTIQLVSLETRAEAEKYAEPFVAANYMVVINQASVPGKGTWYRVGIGLFGTHEEAKKYLDQEKSLFRGKKYLINQIK